MTGRCVYCNKKPKPKTGLCEEHYDNMWDAVMLDVKRDEADEYYAELKARLDERSPA